VVVVSGPVLHYEEARLVGDLSKLPPVARATFAAACAERMLALYRWFHERTGRGDPVVLEGALAALWTDLVGGDSTGLEAQQNVAEELVPYEDDSWVDECAFAQHAAAAVAYAIRCRLTSEEQEAGWAARQVYEALDLWVTTRDDVDVNAAGVEDRITADPLIQAELARQQREIEQLREASDDQMAALASRIRKTAWVDGTTLFGTAM
jgi:uncharacterized protein YjaG (DUF416 family)